ncbi:MAG: plastocyanin/azurin family copper-binding protein [Actinomycetota bacterium]
MSLDTRLADARTELEEMFVNTDIPPFERMRRGRNRRRALLVGGAAVAVVALALGATTMLGDSGEAGEPNDRVDSAVPPTIAEPLSNDGPALSTIDIAAQSELRYEPNSLEVETGIHLVRLTSEGGAHTLHFEDTTVRFRPLRVQATGDVDSARVFFSRPGEYVFFDDSPGHRDAGMEGHIVVTGEEKSFAAARGELASAPPTNPRTTTTTIPRPDRLVAVRTDGVLVELDPTTGDALGEIARLVRLGDSNDPTGPNIITRVRLSLDGGGMFYEECCEPVGGRVHRVGASAPIVGVSPAPGGTGDAIELAVFDETSAPWPSIRIYELATMTERHRIDVRGALVVGLAWSPDGSQLAMLLQADEGVTGIRTVDVAATDLSRSTLIRPDAGKTFVALEYDPSNRLVVGETDRANAEANARLVYAGRGLEEELARIPAGGIVDVSISSRGRVLVVGDDTVLRVLEGETFTDLASGYSAADWADRSAP